MLRRAQIFILLLFLLASQAYSQTVTRTSFFSSSLGISKNIDIYLPPGYDTSPNTYYPVIYFLHGWGSFNGTLQPVVNEAHTKILNNEIEPAIIVCADNNVNPFDGTLYLNSILWGDYEDFMVYDLPNWLETNYRIIPERKYRGLLGQSMGGYGAFNLGIKHKEKFSALSAHAAPVGLDVIIDTLRQGALGEIGGLPPYSYQYAGTQKFVKIIFLGAGGFSPDSLTPQSYVSPSIVQYPFDSLGVLIDTVFGDKWMDFEISNLIKSISSSDDLGILYGCGTNDELRFYRGNLALEDTLIGIELNHEFVSITGGDHSLAGPFIRRSLDFLDSLMLPPVFICDLPTDLLASNITDTSVILNWTENGDATLWQIRYGLSVFDTIGSAIISTNSNPFSIDTLTPGTSYDWYVRSMCTEGDSSIWVGPNTFNTLCDDPTQLLAFNISDTSASLKWLENGVASLWQLRFGLSEFDTTGITPLEVSNDTIISDTLIASTEYDFYVRSDCGSGEYSLWTGPYTFNTLCATPSDMLASNSTESSIDLSWTENGISSQWQIRLDTLGFDTTGVTPVLVSNDTITIDTLLPSKSYDWYVRAYCGEGDSSLWVGPHNFNTACGVPDSLMAFNILDTLASIKWKETGIATEWQIRFDTAGFDTTGIVPVSVFNDTIVVDTLSPSTAYDWYVRAYCGEGDSSLWVGPHTFNTACGIPDSMIAFNITDTLASITWKETGMAAEWQIRFDTAGFDTTGVVPVLVSNDTINIDTLLPSTSYEWYIRAYCGLGDSSAWVGPNNFTTACGVPSDLIAYNILDTAASLTWTETGVATQWQIRFDTLGFDTTGVTPVLVSNDTITIDTLLPSTSYDWYIRAYCGANDSSEWIGPSTLSTIISPVELPFTETWETSSGIKTNDGFVSGGSTHYWSFSTSRQNEGRVRWGSDAYQVYEGNGAVTLDRAYSGFTTIENLILTINLENYQNENLELSFWWADHTDENHSLDKIWIRGSENDQWVGIYPLLPQSMEDNVYSFVGYLDIDSVLSNANPVQNVSNTFQLKFVQVDNDQPPGDGMSFDNIQIRVRPCYTPSDLVANNITQTSAEVSWIENGNATNWELLFDRTGFDPAFATPVPTTSNSVVIDTLTSNTAYDCYIRANCSDGDSSEWFGPYTFFTPCDPKIAPYFEHFDSIYIQELPDCWSQITSTSSASVGATDILASSADNSIRLYNGFGTFGDTINIMPLGNSVTQSSSGYYSYRYYLWKKLIDDQIPFDYVGTLNTNQHGNPVWPDYKGLSFDQDHEGHSGWRADFVSLYINSWMNIYTPDIVLMHLGTNDLIQDQSVESTIIDLKGIINKLRAGNPNVAIFLAQILPADSTLRDWWGQVPILNDSINSIADDLYDPQSPIIIVDQFTGFNPTLGEDTYDGLHPNDGGEIKMADKWFEALDSLPNTHQNEFVALISPEFSDFTSQNNQVRFSARCNSGSDTLYIGTINDPGDKDTYSVYDTVLLSDSFTEYTIRFDLNYTGSDNYFVFKQGMHKTLSSIYIDDVNYEPIPCYSPSDITLDTLAQEIVRLSWANNNNEASWEILFDTTGFDTTGVSPTIINSNPLTIDTLSEFTSYDFYIRANCLTGFKSDWIGPYTFTTLYYPIPAPFYEPFDQVSGPDLPDHWKSGTTISSAIVEVTSEQSHSPDNSIRLFNGNLLFGDTINIVTLGNSITQSNGSYYSYRYHLWKKLIDDQLQFDLVGSGVNNFSSNPSWPDYKGLSFDRDHEGHWSWRADELNTGLATWLNLYTPDIALIHAGTVDLYESQTIESTMLDLENIIDKLRADNPNVAILLAKIIPVDPINSWYDQIPVLNDSIPVVAENKYDPSSPIIVVDQFTGFDPTIGVDSWDGIHPNHTGDDKMAQIWRDALYMLSYPDTDEFIGLISPKLADLTSQENQIRFVSKSILTSDTLFIGSITNPDSINTYTPYDTLILSDVFNEFTVEFNENYLLSDNYFVLRKGTSNAFSSVFVDDIYYERIPCYPPSNLGADSISQSGVLLCWTENGDASEWQIRFDTAGFDTTGIVPVSVFNDTIVVDTLSPSTAYDWYVRAYCGEGDSSLWVGPHTFNTACRPIYAPFIENFDTWTLPDLPECWDTITSDPSATIELQDVLSNSPDNAISIFNGTNSNAFVALVTPEINDLTSQANQIRFMSRSLSGSDSLFIGTMGDPSDVLTYNSFDTLVTTDVFSEFIIPFDDEYIASDPFIVFRMGMFNTSSTLFIDDLYYEVIPYLSLNTNDTIVEKLPDSLRLFVNSNTNWIVVDSSDWIDIVPSSGFGSDSITVYYNTNTYGRERTDTIPLITAGGAKDTLFFTQDSPYYQPLWYGNPYHPMNILVDSAVLNGQQLSAGDEIGVFDVDSVGNELCVGVGVVTGTIAGLTPVAFVAATDDPLTDTVDGFEAGNPIRYKIWNSAAGEECDQVFTIYDPLFDSIYTSLGTAIVELEGKDDTAQSISLIAGWNIHSFFVTPDTLDMIHIHQKQIDSGQLVKIIDEKGGFIQYIPGLNWWNTIGDMALTEGYYIKVDTITTIEVTGPPEFFSYEIPMIGGWNIIGYPIMESQNALDAVQPLIAGNKLIKVIDEAGGFIQDIPELGWFNTIGSFMPGEGYYVKVAADTNLVLNYPASTSMQPEYYQHPNTIYFDLAYQNNPFMTMNIIIDELQTESLNIRSGDEIGVYDGDLCVGAGMIYYENGKYRAIIRASMDDPTTEVKDGYTTGQGITFKYAGSKYSNAVELYASESNNNVFEPLETIVCSLNSDLSALPSHGNNDLEVAIYPNPTESNVYIQFDAPEQGDLKIQLFDINGNRVIEVNETISLPGPYKSDILLDKLFFGVYYLKFEFISSDDYYFTGQKIIKQ